MSLLNHEKLRERYLNNKQYMGVVANDNIDEIKDLFNKAYDNYDVIVGFSLYSKVLISFGRNRLYTEDGNSGDNRIITPNLLEVCCNSNIHIFATKKSITYVTGGPIELKVGTRIEFKNFVFARIRNISDIGSISDLYEASESPLKVGDYASVRPDIWKSKVYGGECEGCDEEDDCELNFNKPQLVTDIDNDKNIVYLDKMGCCFDESEVKKELKPVESDKKTDIAKFAKPHNKTTNAEKQPEVKEKEAPKSTITLPTATTAEWTQPRRKYPF